MTIIRTQARVRVHSDVSQREVTAKTGKSYVFREVMFLDSDMNKVPLNLPDGVAAPKVGTTIDLVLDCETEFRNPARVVIVSMTPVQ